MSVNNNSPSQDYTTNSDDHSNHNIDSPGFKPFTVIHNSVLKIGCVALQAHFIAEWRNYKFLFVFNRKKSWVCKKRSESDANHESKTIPLPAEQNCMNQNKIFKKNQTVLYLFFKMTHISKLQCFFSILKTSHCRTMLISQ